MKARLRHEVRNLVYVVIDVPIDQLTAHFSFIDSVLLTGKGEYRGISAGPRFNRKTKLMIEGWSTFCFMMDQQSWKQYKKRVRIRDKDDG